MFLFFLKGQQPEEKPLSMGKNGVMYENLLRR